MTGTAMHLLRLCVLLHSFVLAFPSHHDIASSRRISAAKCPMSETMKRISLQNYGSSNDTGHTFFNNSFMGSDSAPATVSVFNISSSESVRFEGERTTSFESYVR